MTNLLRKNLFILVPILILFCFILSGCEDIGYIKNLPNQDVLFNTNQEHYLNYYVVNPTENTFIGTLEYDYDDICLNIYNNDKELEITPTEIKKPISTLIKYNGHKNNEDKCIDKPLKVIINVNDKGGDTKDSKTVIFLITK